MPWENKEAGKIFRQPEREKIIFIRFSHHLDGQMVGTVPGAPVQA